MATLNKLKEAAKEFKNRWNTNPIIDEKNETVILAIYRKNKEGDVYQSGKQNSQFTISQRTDYCTCLFTDKNSIGNLESYITLENFSLTKQFHTFLNLQNINKPYLSLTNKIPNGYKLGDVEIIDQDKFKNYLGHLNKVNAIKQKANSIVKDKFSLKEDKTRKEVNTAAIFSNVGYIVKDFEGKYVSLSKGDRTFIKNFMDDQIKEGAYRLTIKETLPLYQESLKEIIKIGDEILNLTGNKNKIKQFSRNSLGTERKTLESCWQLYFEKYLPSLLMSYKNFFPQTVFKPMQNYDKDSRPDFLAVDLYNNIDIIEIKHHRTRLFNKEQGRDSYYPSHELTKAVFQLNKYIDLDKECINLDQIKDPYIKSCIESSKIYRPQGLLIISSQDQVCSDATNEEISARLEKEIRKLKTTYTNINIVLFDELLQNLKNYIEHIDIYLQ